MFGASHGQASPQLQDVAGHISFSSCRQVFMAGFLISACLPALISYDITLSILICRHKILSLSVIAEIKPLSPHTAHILDFVRYFYCFQISFGKRAKLPWNTKKITAVLSADRIIDSFPRNTLSSQLSLHQRWSDECLASSLPFSFIITFEDMLSIPRWFSDDLLNSKLPRIFSFSLILAV